MQPFDWTARNFSCFFRFVVYCPSSQLDCMKSKWASHTVVLHWNWNTCVWFNRFALFISNDKKKTITCVGTYFHFRTTAPFEDHLWKISYSSVLFLMSFGRASQSSIRHRFFVGDKTTSTRNNDVCFPSISELHVFSLVIISNEFCLSKYFFDIFISQQDTWICRWK